MTTEELDYLIEQKRQELKDLLFTRFALGAMGPMMLSSPARLVAMPAELEDLPEPRPRQNRKAAIAERMAARSNGGDLAGGRRGGGRRTAEFKLEVLGEHDQGASLEQLAARHGIKEGTLAKWVEARSSGSLKVTPFIEDGVIETPLEEPTSPVPAPRTN